MMGDKANFDKHEAVRRMLSAVARFTEARAAVAEFDGQEALADLAPADLAAITAARESLQTAYENARQECVLALAAAEAANCDTPSKAEVVAALALELLDIRLT